MPYFWYKYESFLCNAYPTLISSLLSWGIERYSCHHGIDNIWYNIIGVAVGSGWQAYVAYINIGCYYLIGLPLGIIMGWVFKSGVIVRIVYYLTITSRH